MLAIHTARFGKGSAMNRKILRYCTGNGAGMAAGIAIGIALGTAMDNLAIGMCIGVAIGAAFEGGKPKKPQGTDQGGGDR